MTEQPSGVALTEPSPPGVADELAHDHHLNEETEAPVFDAELVEYGAGDAAPYLVTQHTVLAPGQLPPRTDERPAWSTADFYVTAEDAEELDGEDLAENTRVNRDSTVRAFQAWCAAQDPPRLARPCTTATYTAYGLHLIRRGKAGEFKPDTVKAYMSRISSWQPVDLRPDATRVKGKLRTWRKAWAEAGGEVERSAALTIEYSLALIAACDENTNIGKRDAFLVALGYANLHREMELADLLVRRLRIHPTGIHVGTASSKTDQQGKGSSRFIEDRPDLRLVARARAWLAVLEELGADGPDQPVFRSLTAGGNPRTYPEGRKRGTRMRPGSLNERIQHLAGKAGLPYIDDRKVTAHSLRAGANTDMAAAGVPLAERNRAGRWAPGSHTADTVYDRPHGLAASDPLAKVPVQQPQLP
ncbi:hypothetical protein [Streptomyces sp. NPDC059874]|uniref:hypothetical protein n=1 Tax=Streptomyces sp. NPDC059874 TaxID=3346983 RepID=UPI003661A387